MTSCSAERQELAGRKEGGREGGKEGRQAGRQAGRKEERREDRREEGRKEGGREERREDRREEGKEGESAFHFKDKHYIQCVLCSFSGHDFISKVQLNTAIILTRKA